MPDIRIHRDLTGHVKARQMPFAGLEQVEAEFGMECTYEDSSRDRVCFTRSGVDGGLIVTGQHF